MKKAIALNDCESFGGILNLCQLTNAACMFPGDPEKCELSNRYIKHPVEEPKKEPKKKSEDKPEKKKEDGLPPRPKHESMAEQWNVLGYSDAEIEKMLAELDAPKPKHERLPVEVVLELQGIKAEIVSTEVYVPDDF